MSLDIIGDLFTSAYRLGDPDDFDLLGYRPVEERCQAEADEDGEQNTKHSDHSTISQKTHTGHNLLVLTGMAMLTRATRSCDELPWAQ